MRLHIGWIVKTCSALVILCFSASSAWSHAGHSVEVVSDQSPLHYVVQPEHAAGWILLSLALATGFWLLRTGRRRQQQLLRVRK